MTAYGGVVLTIMIDAGIDEYPLEPAFQAKQYIILPLLIELMDIPEKFYKPFIHDLLGFLLRVGIPVADLHCKATEQVIQFLLAVTVIHQTAPDQCSHLWVICMQQWFGLQ